MENRKETGFRDVFIIGAKSIGQYGGYESFVDHLTEQHQSLPGLHYNIIIKANGEGAMDESAQGLFFPMNSKKPVSPE